MQSIITCIVSFVLSAVGGKFLIPALRALHVGQSIREVGPTWHNSKQGTPVMGGLMFIGSALVCILTALGSIRSGDYTYLIVYVFALIFGVIGFLDDFIKVRKKRNLGLTELQKLLLQLIAAALYLVVLRKTGHLSSDLYIPFFNVSITIPWVLYLLLSIFIIVGTVNAVNLTDGIDGLASSVTLVVACAFMLASGFLYQFGINAFSAALAGACCGFIVWNAKPAKVFMGDTGSMFLGGAVVAISFGTERPVLLLLAGITYFAEALSDILQVAHYKRTKKRLFKMAPLHHHFEMCGWSEQKIVLVFSGVAALGSLLALLPIIFNK